MTKPTITRRTRRSLSLLAALAVVAGSTVWSSSTSAQPAPPAALEFTVSPAQFESSETFTVTIEGTGCVDPNGPTDGKLTAVFWLNVGDPGDDHWLDRVIGQYDVEADGSFEGSQEVHLPSNEYEFFTLPSERLIEGICTYTWPDPTADDIVARGQQQITVVVPADHDPTSPTTAATEPSITEPSVPAVVTPLATAPSAQPVAAAPAYTG